MNVPVLWVSWRPEILARGYADQGLLEAILDRSVWSPPGAIHFDHHEVRGDFPDVDGAVVVINARTHASPTLVARFVAELDRLDWSVVLLCGDEEWDFPWRAVLAGPSRKVWAMQARPEHADLDGFLPGGWYPGTRELLAGTSTGRPLDWFFGGQVTHERRRACAEVLRTMPGGHLVETTRYLEEGLPRDAYFRVMASAKVIPCPSGPYSVDCARTFEALEAGCVPVADVQTAYAGAFDYWTLLFGETPPFPTIWDWSTFPDVLAKVLADWPQAGTRCWAFWQAYKRALAHRLDDQIRAAAGIAVVDRPGPDDRITVVVTTSPTVQHPSTDHIEQVIASVRAQLPTAEVIVACDGVRPEQEYLRVAYEQYLYRLCRLTNFEWSNVVPVVLDEWGHQANVARAALALVTTPLVLFVEHDTPLVGEIPWLDLCGAISTGQVNVIRFHEDTEVIPEHRGVMLDDDPIDIAGVPIRRTSAWWQRPHLASAWFYRDRVMPHFGPATRTMIEDRLYGPVSIGSTAHDGAGWWDWRVGIYQPPGNMRRSGHLDSRGDEPKYDMRF